MVNIFGKRERKFATRAGDRIYAIGDVHGCYELLRRLLDKIEAHTASLPPARSPYVVLLGDLIDRGDRSADIIHLARSIQRHTPRFLVLQGNHEEMMVAAYEGDLNAVRPWLEFGGDATLRSFGITLPGDAADVREIVAAMRAAIPEDLIDWMRNLPVTAQSGDYFFCHAGIRPGVRIKRQNREDLIWIRDDFLEDRRDHGVMVVHGHSVTTTTEFLSNRIGIDSGAFRTGVLTALYLEGSERELLTAE